MTDPNKIFLAPRLSGRRFQDHSIPLELLKDLAAIEELAFAAARWLYLKEHQNRQRVPRGFMEGLSLNLVAVESGSATPVIRLEADESQLFPQEGEMFLTQAGERIIGAVAAAENDDKIGDHLPAHLLVYFDRISRRLRDDECIEFDPTNPARPARLNRSTRKIIRLAAPEMTTYTDEIRLRGAIPEMDQHKRSFQLHLIYGPNLKIDYTPDIQATVKEAFNEYKSGARVLLRGIGRFDRNDNLEAIESVEGLALLERNDVGARLDEFRSLRQDWLDGSPAHVPSPEGLNWLTHAFELNYPGDLDLPFLYPTPEGGVLVEWTVGHQEISLDINLEERAGEWHALNMANDQEVSEQLNLNDRESWKWIADQLKASEEARK